MQTLKYRTTENWGVMSYPVITITEHDTGFVACAYSNINDIQVGIPRAGIFDILEFEMFEDENEN